MVETTGIEPVTPCMSSKYSNQLSYASILEYNTILVLELQGENEKNYKFLFDGIKSRPCYFLISS